MEAFRRDPSREFRAPRLVRRCHRRGGPFLWDRALGGEPYPSAGHRSCEGSWPRGMSMKMGRRLPGRSGIRWFGVVSLILGLVGIGQAVAGAAPAPPPAKAQRDVGAQPGSSFRFKGAPANRARSASSVSWLSLSPQGVWCRSVERTEGGIGTSDPRQDWIRTGLSGTGGCGLRPIP